MPSSDKTGLLGTQQPESGGSEYNALRFLFDQSMSETATATVVKVMAVTNSGGISPVGFVDVQPTVNQVDGYGEPVPHGTIHNLPYMRMQGGANAIILDPQVGDLGIAVFAREDISSVKATKAVANPGSSRRFDMADGMYIGGLLNGTPTQYVAFTAAGIVIHSATEVKLDAPSVKINASGAVTITSGTLTHNGKNIGVDHKHSGVTIGSSNTGNPV